MEIKKTPKADLENKKSTWLLVGYVIVLAFMFIAFEWTKRDIKIDTSQAITDLVFEEEIIPITEQPEQAAPPPKHKKCLLKVDKMDFQYIYLITNDNLEILFQ